MLFVDAVRERASQRLRRIVFPESGDERVIAAVRRLAADRIAEPVIVLDPANQHHEVPSGVEAIDPTTDPRTARVRDTLLMRRRAKGAGLSDDKAARLALTPLYFADDLVRAGDVDGCVAGCVLTTAEVMRAALWLIGAAAGVRTVSSAFYMAVRAFRGDVEEVLTFTDCAVLPSPTAEQLADIAIAAARDRSRIVGDAARVAFLSFSTRGSAGGEHESVERVRQAVRLAKERAPEFHFDGELQGDAALIAAVATRKTSGGEVAGRANVLVFPSLDAGNIAYKLVERLAQARAVGPIVQGLARPCNDLSRGASVDDIINVAAVTSLQASDVPG
ncbi:MAG: phosphate acetyltransferase [Gemmatimonadaceae bacterium]